MLLRFLLVWVAVSSGAKVEFSSVGEQIVAANRSCTVDELLPRALPSNSSISPEWSQEEVVELPYGCDCSFFKARYFCEHDDKKAHRKWEPHAESEGICESAGLSDLSEAPFPPKFKVLFYGNSHMRQVVETMMCQFPKEVLFKRMKYTGGGISGVRTIDGEVACRACHTPEDEAAVVGHDCIPEHDVVSEACSCDDDRGEFFMANGAILHFYFAHMEKNKSIERALRSHDNVPWSYYDAVFANSGNPPRLSEESVLATAFELQNASVPFFFLSSYAKDDKAVSEWEEHNRVLFHASGARYVDIRIMTHGLTSLTRGAVEPPKRDGHFCLPGPPDQMGLLLLKIMWAVHQEKFDPAR